MAITQVNNKHFASGIKTYENAIHLLVDKTRLYLLQYNLGLAYRKNKQLEDALKILTKSYLSEPTYEKAYVAIARVYKEMKKLGLTPDSSLIRQVKDARQQQSGEKKTA